MRKSWPIWWIDTKNSAFKTCFSWGIWQLSTFSYTKSWTTSNSSFLNKSISIKSFQVSGTRLQLCLKYKIMRHLRELLEITVRSGTSRSSRRRRRKLWERWTTAIALIMEVLVRKKLRLEPLIIYILILYDKLHSMSVRWLGNIWVSIDIIKRKRLLYVHNTL